ncbi:hypothetical protein N9Q74_01065 [Ascidiaceihabitans sp.]|nr:hypothetical protein [Ascidiaceihabitans sp.]
MNVPRELWLHDRLGFFHNTNNAKSEKYYHGNDDSMRARFLPAHRQLPWSWLALLFSIILVLFSIYLDVFDSHPAVESGLWFQRSGAVLVMASFWVEWNSSRADLGGNMSMAFNHISLSKRYVRWIKTFSRMGFVCAVIGTAIWAYGDKIIS